MLNLEARTVVFNFLLFKGLVCGSALALWFSVPPTTNYKMEHHTSSEQLRAFRGYRRLYLIMLTDYPEWAAASFIHVIGQTTPPDLPVFHPSQSSRS